MKQNIENLINYQIKNEVITKRDYNYVKNQLYFLLKEEQTNDYIEPIVVDDVSKPLNNILDILEKRNVLDGSIVSRDLFDAKIMNIFAMHPSKVEQKFYELHKEDSTKATKWLYNYASNLNYIRLDRIKKNIGFSNETKYGLLEITINLSKPEKDPKSIILASNTKQTAYPKCVLCVENEGFAGNFQRDSRDQHRLIEVDLNKEKWYFQYSPYIYYNEHAIVLSKEHRPMKISKQVFENLFTLTKIFKGYFFGSNADLPIVGGSILSHDHYQGGLYKFPIESAKVIFETKKDDVSINILKWPLSTIRLKSNNLNNLVNIADQILTKYKKYNNDELNIKSHTNDTPHNTITPIARMNEDIYELDLILRNNLTSELHPLGIFHPHEDKWHLKKENIGLIEAIGLAILPGRLVDELSAVKDYLVNNKPLSNDNLKHEAWANSFKDRVNKDNVDEIIEQEVSNKFADILEDCGVFKEKDLEQFKNFVLEAIK